MRQWPFVLVNQKKSVTSHAAPPRGTDCGIIEHNRCSSGTIIATVRDIAMDVIRDSHSRSGIYVSPHPPLRVQQGQTRVEQLHTHYVFQ